ncbi:alkaline phosphatase D family protein [Nocardiopsis baichengensis]|uniref:alkaline phosphatase D family protein n=1 Tax=Nocardiopsis baichengensis TaxID=280240 RepID=UPI00034A73C3|nr:alkaline phosphatase D family protein [Nocardiopsis baichengensis]
MSDVPLPQSPSSPSASEAGRHRATRRGVLLGGAAAMGAAAIGALTPAPAHAGRGRLHDPFTLGVASGDPLPDGVVLWTRLAPEPLAESGLGGMPERRFQVQWQISEDERFRRITAAGTCTASPESAHAVHVEVSGLRPGAEYFYRFRVQGHLSPVGRTRTAPAPGSSPDRFSFAFASCQSYTNGHYTAQAHLAREDLDLVVFLGDYIYEYGEEGDLGRPHIPSWETVSLSDYRIRHAQYKSDPDLQAAHAAFPWALVFDDHEVDNNWADDIPENGGDPQEFLRRRAAAFRAYYENMPLRRAQRPRGADVQMFRRLTFGDLVDLHLLDTRQYRSDQVGDPQHDDPDRTLLGERQRRWLFDGLNGPTARWNVLGQQVFFSQRDFVEGPATNFSNDAWDGYRYERDRVRDVLASGPSNPVVITGDVHANYLCDVKADFDDPDSATVATELVGTSFTSGGDGTDQNPGDAVQLQENPHIRMINRRRGYVRNTVTPTEWTADYRVVDRVSEPGAPIRDLARYVIEDGRPGAVDPESLP